MNPRDFCRERGYDIGVLVTYDFDPIFFERVVLRDLSLGGSSSVLVVADARRINESQNRWVGQLRDLGQRYQLVSANLRGAFHPKMILRAGPKGAAVWIGSGNVTSGGWGANLELGSAWKVGPETGDFGAWLRTVLDQLSHRCPPRLDLDVVARVRDLPWLHSLQSQEEGEPPVLISQDTRPLSVQMSERWSGRRFEGVRIVTGSTDQGGELLRWLHEAFGVSRAKILLQPDRASFDPDRLARLPLEVEILSPKVPRTVHAKFYWFDGPDGPAAVIGSANCSSAAWLLGPRHGGNVELVTVYDDPSPLDFAHILERFELQHADRIALTSTGNKPAAEKGPSLQFPVADIAWERTVGELTIQFFEALPEGSEVEVQIRGQDTTCWREDSKSKRWFARPKEPFEYKVSAFLHVLITLPGGHELDPRIQWVNDLAELRHAVGGRRIADTLRDFGRPQASSEQRKILTELQRIGSALLSERTLFHDPLSISERESRRPEDDGPEDTQELVDPDKLIRALSEVEQCERKVGTSAGLRGLTLVGVMRALFDGEEEEQDESDAADEPKDPEVKPEPDQVSRRTPQGPDLQSEPDHKMRVRLKKQIEKFLDLFGQVEFAQTCTATQMIQAAAYPLTVAERGRRSGWVDSETAEEWAVRVFDILFEAPYGREPEAGLVERVSGLLEAVRLRYRAKGQEGAFQRIAGDGTLWSAMLFSLGNLSWRGTTAGLQRALSLRSLLKSKDLVASADLGRMRTLIVHLEERLGSESLLAAARNANELLQNVEKYLEINWKTLVEAQAKLGVSHREDDILWREQAGWVVALEGAPISKGANLHVYRHKKGRNVLVRANYYLNVSQSAEIDMEISRALRQLEVGNPQIASR